LRADLPDIVRVIQERCPRARIVISTNALMPARIERMMEKMRGVAVRVSIDGYGEVDDVVRGIPGGFDKAVETLRRLRAAGHEDLGISATVSRLAVGELPKLKKLADDEGVQFVCGIAHSSETYFGDQEDAFPWDGRQTVVDNLIALREVQLRSARVKDWFRAYFTDGLVDFVYNEPRRLFCRAGTEMLYLTPEGDVYPCNALNRKMGSLHEADYETILARSEDTLRVVRNCPVNCWMSCTVAPAMRRAPWVPARWIVGAKFFGAGKTPKRADTALPPRPPARVRARTPGPGNESDLLTTGVGAAEDDETQDGECGSSR
jgi:MoaA/NifB/PqqE/SkfB family radical SAM enzyme